MIARPDGLTVQVAELFPDSWCVADSLRRSLQRIVDGFRGGFSECNRRATAKLSGIPRDFCVPAYDRPQETISLAIDDDCKRKINLSFDIRRPEALMQDEVRVDLFANQHDLSGVAIALNLCLRNRIVDEHNVLHDIVDRPDCGLRERFGHVERVRVRRAVKACEPYVLNFQIICIDVEIPVTRYHVVVARVHVKGRCDLNNGLICTGGKRERAEGNEHQADHHCLSPVVVSGSVKGAGPLLTIFRGIEGLPICLSVGSFPSLGIRLLCPTGGPAELDPQNSLAQRIVIQERGKGKLFISCGNASDQLAVGYVLDVEGSTQRVYEDVRVVSVVEVPFKFRDVAVHVFLLILWVVLPDGRNDG